MPPVPALDRATIVDTAVEILERDGVDGLSMRRLATALGSKPMTLYHYVPNKSALLSMALSEIASRIPWQAPAGEPRDRMVGIAVDMYVKLGEIPWIVAILRQGTNIGTPALVLADQFLTAGTEAGLDELAAVSLWRSVWYLVASELQWQHTLAARAADERSWFESIDPTELDHVPTIQAMIRDWADFSGRYDLRSAISDQIDGALSRVAG
ncbi:TetR/AcrR family transcriptional regulator [Gordonia soli]|uniref:Putative TetR family transcriptional regulator n=1 Tax=Gordonia soli NBRC 108243 TaxID=1223545 RepID=M0QKK7_9ACTN|nr:TetR family transcriptional regulator [Gordonia soli]GAC68974.1 putative TetR family transcriptional regulator [Gordonia soli NBRC 108243]